MSRSSPEVEVGPGAPGEGAASKAPEAPGDHQAIDEAVTEELVALYERQSLRTGPVIGLIAVLIGAAAWRHAPSWLVIGWVLLEWTTLTVRHVGMRLSPRLRVGARQRLRIAQGLRALHALSNASAVVFFPFLSDLGRTLVTLILAGLTTGAIGTSGGYLPVYLVYAGPVMVALMLGWSFTPVHGEDGWLSRFMAPLVMAFTLIMVGLARDNFRAFRKAVAKRMEEGLLNKQLRAALDQAQAANAAKTRFLASASHDLRQPLHSLSLFFATLRLQAAPRDGQQGLLDHIDQALSALQTQMDTLLDMSKLDAGMVQLDWRHFALPPLLGQIRSAYAPVALQKNLRLSVECPDPLHLYSDSEQFSRVLRNLVDNAIKYTSRGEVIVEARPHGADQVRVRIRDSGCGIAPAHQGQVFEEFFQVDNPERDRNRGLGLGLPIVRRLAGLLRIELELHSVPGAGTTVTLLIPRGAEPAPVQEARPADLRDFQPSMPRCHVLVIDDEAAVRAGTQALLNRMGCDVTLAASIAEAEALTADHPPDLVLADLRLRAQESGITAVHRLRQQHPHLAAIIITGDTAPDRLQQAQAAGLQVLHKPVAADALMRAIAASLEDDGA